MSTADTKLQHSTTLSAVSVSGKAMSFARLPASGYNRFSTSNSQYGRFPSSNTNYTTNYSAGASSISDLDLGTGGLFSQVAQITEHLFLSSCHPVKENRMRQMHISLIVNATLEVPPLRMADVDTLQVPVDDNPYANLKSYFDIVADRINGEVRRGRRVLVHCMAGVSRSTSLVLAYLMKYKNMTLKEAHDHVKARRSFIRPNNGFWRQLCDYEERLFGVRTIRMVTSPVGYIPDIYKDEGGGRGMWIPAAPVSKPRPAASLFTRF